jgi:hypothetical protein
MLSHHAILTCMQGPLLHPSRHAQVCVVFSPHIAAAALGFTDIALLPDIALSLDMLLVDDTPRQRKKK